MNRPWLGSGTATRSTQRFLGWVVLVVGVLGGCFGTPGSVAAQDTQLTPEDLVRRVQSGELGPAVEALERRLAEDTDPALVDVALRLAELSEQAEALENAQRLARAVARHVDSPRAFVLLTRLAHRRGDLDGALDLLRQALELAPNSEDLLATYGRLQLGRRTPTAAIGPFEALGRMHPSNAEYPYLEGVAWMQAGDLTRAVENFARSRQLAPRRARTLIALGLASNGQKRFTEAQEVLVEALRYAPDSLEALAALAEAEEGLGLLEAADSRALRVLASNPDHAAANRVLGMVRMQQQRYPEARQALERSVAIDPAAKTHYQLSLACSRLGDSEAARHHLDAYRQALEEQEAQLLAIRGADTPTAEGESPP